MNNITAPNKVFQTSSLPLPQEHIYAEPPSWPRPAHDDAFYGIAGEVVGLIEPHSEADNMALLIQFLTGIGNLVGRSRYFSAQGSRHYSNLFVVIVGDTAKARKGSSWGPLSQIFSQVDEAWFRERVTSGLSSGEGLAWNVRDPMISVRGKSDPGVPDKRLLVIEEEFASVLKVIRREGSTLSPLIRNAWDGKPLRVLTKNDPTTATNTHVSIIGHITATELKRHLTETESANGFGNRFLWLCVRRSKLLPDGGKFEQENLSSLVRRLREVVEFAGAESPIVRDDDSAALWEKHYADLSEGLPGLLGSMTARREAQTMRLAQLYAILDKSDTIKVSHLKAAMAVERCAFDSSRYLFGDSLGDAIADTILSALRNSPEGLSRSEITRDLFKRNKPEEQISRALYLLEANGYARKQTEATNGRSIERWLRVHTKLTT